MQSQKHKFDKHCCGGPKFLPRQPAALPNLTHLQGSNAMHQWPQGAPSEPKWHKTLPKKTFFPWHGDRLERYSRLYARCRPLSFSCNPTALFSNFTLLQSLCENAVHFPFNKVKFLSSNIISSEKVLFYFFPYVIKKQVQKCDLWAAFIWHFGNFSFYWTHTWRYLFM